MKIGSTTNYFMSKFGDVRGLEILAEAGFDALDYGLFKYPMEGPLFCGSEEDFVAYFSSIKAECDRLGLMVGQLHSPMPSYTGDEERDERIFQAQEKSIHAAALLGSKYIIVHPCIPRRYRYTCYREETKAINMRFYGRLAPSLEKYGVKLCIENMFNYDPELRSICPTVCTTSWEMKDDFKTLAAPDLFTFCLDIGHANLTGDTPERMIYDLGEHLETLHVHDNNGLKDQHTCPYHGTINWPGVMKALREVGYKGVFSFEADDYYRIYDRAIPEESAKFLCRMGHFLTEKL